MSNTRTPGQAMPARGSIIELCVQDGREVALLDSTTEPVVTLDFVRGQPLPSVRANEVATLLRDPFLANALKGCRNMEQRKAVLLPIAQQGYKVEDALATPPASPPPVATPAPAATPGATPADFDPSEFVTKVEHNRLADTIATVDGTLGMAITALSTKIDTLAPTVISIGVNEPVTFPADEIIHEAAVEIIEDMADGMHVYMTGEPGTGKSRLAVTVAKALGFADDDIVIFPVSNMDQKNSLMGYNLPTTGEYQRGPLYDAFQGKFVVLEELDAGNGAAMTATNIALDAPYVTFPNGETLERPDQVFIIGAGNTTGKGGDMMFLRNQMDAATRNRWVFHHVTYDRNLERQVISPILGDLTERWLTYCWAIREAVEGERVVFSTRNIRHGAMMLRRGRDIGSIVERALLPGESTDIVRKSGALTTWA